MSAYHVIDTNVVVAGLITAQTDYPVALILEGMLGGTFPCVLSPALLAEYREVLLRPKIVKRHGLLHDQVDNILTALARHAIVLTPPADGSAPPAPDPGDQFLWDLLALRPGLLLVTGDQRLLQDAALRPRVISPAAWATGWQR